MRFMSLMGKVQTTVEKSAAGVGAVIILVLMFLTAADVTGRYVFTKPIQGATELSMFMMVAIVLLCVGYVQSVKGHVAMDIATTWLSRRAQVALDTLAYFLGLVVYSIVTWQSAIYAWKAWVTADFALGVVDFPLWPALSLVPLGMGILCLRLASDVYHGMANWLALKRQTNTQEGKGP